MAAPDFYRVLEVASDASGAQIQGAYHRLARRLHPDVNTDPAAHESFLRVSEAYQVLSDPATRSRYDRSARARGGPAPRAGASGWQPTEGTVAGRDWDVPVRHVRGDRGPRADLPREPRARGAWETGFGFGDLFDVAGVGFGLGGRYPAARRVVAVRTPAGMAAVEIVSRGQGDTGQRLRVSAARAAGWSGWAADVLLFIGPTRRCA